MLSEKPREGRSLGCFLLRRFARRSDSLRDDAACRQETPQFFRTVVPLVLPCMQLPQPVPVCIAAFG